MQVPVAPSQDNDTEVLDQPWEALKRGSPRDLCCLPGLGTVHSADGAACGHARRWAEGWHRSCEHSPLQPRSSWACILLCSHSIPAGSA